MNFIHLNINSILSKKMKHTTLLNQQMQLVKYETKLSETKLDNTVLSGDLETEGYDLARKI